MRGVTGPTRDPSVQPPPFQRSLTVDSPRLAAVLSLLSRSILQQRAYLPVQIRAGSNPRHKRAPVFMLSAINFIAGSPANGTAQLNDYLATTRVDQLDVMAHLPRIAMPHVRRSMELLQSHVRPNLVYDPLPPVALAA